MRERDFLSRSRQHTEPVWTRRAASVREHAPLVNRQVQVNGAHKIGTPEIQPTQWTPQAAVPSKPKIAKKHPQITPQKPRVPREANREAYYQRRTPQVVQARNELTPKAVVQRPERVKQQSSAAHWGLFARLGGVFTLPADYIQRFKALSRPQIAMISGGFVIFIFGGFVAIMGLQANSHVEAQTKQVASATTDENAGDVPDETEPDEAGVANYRVSDPHQPRYISIPALDIKSRVRALGTKSNNELKAPANSYDVGWYEKGSKPGYNGATLLNGHVHGPTKPGIFFNLKKLEKGDLIEVERGDGKVFLYQVVKMQQYDRANVDMAAAMTPVESGKQGLNLITCAGALNRSDSSYQDRLVVFASRID